MENGGPAPESVTDKIDLAQLSQKVQNTKFSHSGDGGTRTEQENGGFGWGLYLRTNQLLPPSGYIRASTTLII